MLNRLELGMILLGFMTIPPLQMTLCDGLSLALARLACFRYCDKKCCKSGTVRFLMLWETVAPRLRP
jgi:hypothetical protein